MHIGFDNTSRLCRDVYYFEYKGIRFKLIQNNIRKYCDVLLTIIPGRNNQEAQNIAYITAAEFLSALSWENNSLVKVHHEGGMGIPENFHLKKARCSIYSWPQVPFVGRDVGYDICRIPQIENDNQKNALILFREASSSNNKYLSFLFFWQILEIANSDPIGWINKVYRKNRNKIRVTNNEIQRLPLNGNTIGYYFYDDCRNAIAHIFKRDTGKKKLKLDTLEDNSRISHSDLVIKEFARFYITNNLGLQKSMLLLKRYDRRFPVYVTEKEANIFSGTIAYKRLSPFDSIKKRWH